MFPQSYTFVSTKQWFLFFPPCLTGSHEDNLRKQFSCHLSLCSCFQCLMHSQTFGFWAWKQNSTKKHPMKPLFRILPGMLAVGMLTGKAMGHHMSTLMPAVTPHLTGLGCLLFDSCFCFTPSCGGTKHQLFQSFTKVSLSCSLWFGHLSFVWFKNPVGLHLAFFLWPWDEHDHWQHRGQRLHPCIWPHFIAA